MRHPIRILACIHLAGNALLLWLGYYWLGLSESRAATLLWSALVAVVLLGGACWLHGASFAFFREGLTAFRATLRRLGPVVIAAVAVVAVYALLARWADYSSTPASRVASWLTARLRKPVRPASVLRVFNVALWLVEWAVIPVFALPLVADLASFGWRGLRGFARLAGDWRYWLLTPALLAGALWLPFKVMGWVPQFNAFGMQMASFVARIGAAYVVFTAAWLALVWTTAVGVRGVEELTRRHGGTETKAESAAQ